MKRAKQELGIKPWYGGDLIDLQGEPLDAVEALVSGYGSFVVTGCVASGVTTGVYDVSSGYVAFDDGVARICRFSGATSVSLPIYLVLSEVAESRVYDSGEVEPVATVYSAVSVDNEPLSGEYLTITSTNSEKRLVDAIQDASHRFVTESMYNFLADPVITTLLLQDLAVTTAKLANLAVTADKIGSSAVTTDKINNLAVTETKLANSAVTEDKIGSSAVTETKLAANAITYAKLATALQTLIDSKAGTATATSSADGLMSSTDKAILDGGEDEDGYVVPRSDIGGTMGSSWYIKCNDGTLICGGRVSSSSGTGVETFAHAFANTSYALVLGGAVNQHNNTSVCNITYHAKATGTFSWNGFKTNSADYSFTAAQSIVDYIAIGAHSD